MRRVTPTIAAKIFWSHASQLRRNPGLLTSITMLDLLEDNPGCPVSVRNRIVNLLNEDAVRPHWVRICRARGDYAG